MDILKKVCDDVHEISLVPPQETCAFDDPMFSGKFDQFGARNVQLRTASSSGASKPVSVKSATATRIPPPKSQGRSGANDGTLQGKREKGWNNSFGTTPTSHNVLFKKTSNNVKKNNSTKTELSRTTVVTDLNSEVSEDTSKIHSNTSEETDTAEQPISTEEDGAAAENPVKSV
eukprot:GHVP01061550.1.p1 GENE.GHVP01061550.1~~GHVP01061550.1.p1  ORF type:complete len:174 (-),score=41.08 GHVP01061550.1:105-626(-)